MAPLRLVPALRQQVHAAHQVARIEVLRIDPRLQSHVLVLRTQGRNHALRALGLHVVEQARDIEAGEIISRKATDLDKIQESTFRSYLREFEQKYSVGTEIRSQKYKNELYGKVLEGSYILEVPASNAKLPNIDYYKQIASEYDVTLRFTEE